jgi:hypothetical protein
VEHSLELSGEGEPLDVDYLVSLGPQALPALDRFSAHLDSEHYQSLRHRLLRDLRAAADWRAWSYRDQQLARYLDVPPS